MENILLKKVTENKNNEHMETITKWMYNWWGQRDGYTYDEVQCFMEHCICEERIPQTYIATIKDVVVGMYQISMDDISIRPDIYPWLCNVYVDENYRGFGICKFLMSTVEENMKCLSLKQLYLQTKHIGLYEKFGWKFVENIEIYKTENSLKRLYKLEI